MTDTLTRRTVLSALAGSTAALLSGTAVRAESQRKRLGLADFSYLVRQRKENNSAAYPRFSDTLQLLHHLHEMGFGGLQTHLNGWNKDFAQKVRQHYEKNEMYFEASIALPKTDGDIPHFEAQLDLASEAGATVVRTVCTGSRRYEFFESLEQFKDFTTQSFAALQRAVPIAERKKLMLAVENHKDLRAAELLDFLKRTDSKNLGVTLDTGNNIALLEEMPETLALLAPYVFSVHLKDMAVEEYADGFLLSEVVLGTGTVDLKQTIQTCLKHNPAVQFNLEMPARDPLKVPVLTKKYWITMKSLPSDRLAEILAWVRAHKTAAPLPRVSGLPLEQQLAFEETQLKKCLEFAHEALSL